VIKPLHRQPLGDFLEYSIASLASDFLAEGRVSYRVKPVNDAKNNYIDVVWRKDGRVSHAIEIDSSARKKSVQKLAQEESHVRKIWIYYGSNVRKAKSLIELYGNGAHIELIELSKPKWDGRGSPKFTHSAEWYKWKDKSV
jgi:hypothetical protein